jgi:hypothetical protein
MIISPYSEAVFLCKLPYVVDKIHPTKIHQPICLDVEYLLFKNYNGKYSTFKIY